jgi:hypothetical protein
MKAPKRRSKKYQEIVAKGCRLRYFPFEGDYDCALKYDWKCEDCPCSLEKRRQEEKP